MSAWLARVPLVVRLAGTNVEEGRRIVRECDLPIITADTLAEAANRGYRPHRSIRHAAATAEA